MLCAQKIIAASGEFDLRGALMSQSEVHPRLFISKGASETFVERVRGDRVLSDFADYVIGQADLLISESPVVRELEGRRLLAVSRECLRRIVYWGVAYQLTGDAAYADRARDEMLAAAAFKDWNPDHFLDVAEMTTAMAIGYDWLYHTLDEGARQTIREAIIQLGLKPSLNNELWWIRAGNNWNQVCHGGMVIGALAVFEAEPELAQELIERALTHIHYSLNAYAPDGAYPEGPSYWSFGTSFTVLMISALETVLGNGFNIAQAPGFLGSANYMLHAAGPSGDYFNYSDSRSRLGLRPELYWFAHALNQPELLWSELSKLKAFNQESYDYHEKDRLLPLLLLWAQNLEECPAPQALHWKGAGEVPVAFHRSSWTDSNASFVAIKGGSPSANHAHMDIGQFIMESDGVRWAVDLGMQEYHELESAGLKLSSVDRWKVFRIGNMSHNVLVVDGKLQELSGTAPIVEHTVGEEYSHTIVDMTAVYAGQLSKATRGVALADGGSVVIEDAIETLQNPTEIRWGMVSYAEVQIESSQRARLTQDGQSLMVELDAPASASFEIYEIETPPNAYDAPNPGAKMLGFRVSLPPESCERFSVRLTPGSSGESALSLPPMTEW